MARLSSLKTPNSLHIFSMKPPSSSSLRSMKLKTLFKTFIFSHIYRIARAFAKVKSLVLQLVGDIHFIHLVEFPILKKFKSSKKQKKLFFGSFRLHYNWCTSHNVVPLAQESYSNSHIYYDASWNTVIPTTTSLDDHDRDQMPESDDLSKYLEWLEGKGNQESSSNEIDKLADLFIANCHEKFRLEKQESYRRFQEMLARSA